MPVTPLRATDAAPTLDQIALDPWRVNELAPGDCVGLVVRCAGILATLGARLTETAKPAAPLQPPLDVKAAAPLLGLSADVLARKAKTDPAYQALRFDNGTDRLLFDLAKIEAFRRRRTGA